MGLVDVRCGRGGNGGRVTYVATIRRMELLAYGRSSVIIAFDSDHKSREGFVLLCGVVVVEIEFRFLVCQ